MKNSVVIPLQRCVLEFRGADTVRFLNGQLSNDVRKLTPDRAMHACVMTAKGRMNAEVWLTKLPDGIRVDGPAGLGEDLLARFERYIISDDVTAADVTLERHLVHTVGGEGSIQSQRFGETGRDEWMDSPTTLVAALTAAQIESFRIARGIPLWGAELDENTLPNEAGLERDSIDYHKGCYIGQEVISRLKSVGHVNRQLIRLTAGRASVLQPGAELFSEGKVVGQVTSAAVSLDLECIVALAYVKRVYSTPGTVVATGNGDRFTVQPLQP